MTVENNKSQLRSERGNYSRYEQFQRRLRKLEKGNPDATFGELVDSASNDVQNWRTRHPKPSHVYDCWSSSRLD